MGITHIMHDNYSGSKMQKTLISHGKLLKLLQSDPNIKKIYILLIIKIFGIM